MSKKLEKVRTEIDNGIAPAPVTVRRLLRWFGASRRGSNVVAEIRSALNQHQLTTHPDFELAWIDSHVRFLLESSKEE